MPALVKLAAFGLAGLAVGCGSNGRNIAVDTPNLPPAAAFGSSCAALACSFTDSSTDADGRIMAYRWSFGDGSDEATTRDARHAYAAPGAYTVALRVTDDSGATDSATAEAHAALPPNPPPIAAFGSACDDLACTFTDLSSDADGQIVGYRWSFGDGSDDLTSRYASHAYTAPGTYIVVLTVTDDRGASATASSAIAVVVPNSPPRAGFDGSCVRLTCTFSDGSFDFDGTVVGHHWTFGDGGSADGPNPVHTYAAFGVYHVQLSVTDDQGATGDAAQDVTAATPDHPAIGVSNSFLDFCYRPGATRNCVVLTRILRITSLGATLPGWTVATDQPWIHVSPAAGTTPSDVEVSIDLAPLRPIGSRRIASGSIVVSAAGAFNGPLRIPVTLFFYATILRH